MHEQALLALLALVFLGPRSSEARSSACNGFFECSSLTSEDPNLVLEFTNTSVTCKYGHTEIDGDCQRGCSGVRSAPCRCQTLEEAKDGIKTDARTSLLASLLTIVLGCCCTCGSYRKLFTMKETDESGSEDPSEPSADQHRAGTPNTENDPEVAEPAPQPAQGAAVEGAADAGNQASTPARRRNLIQVASNKAGELAEEHPCKFRIVRIIIPVGILALIIWGAYQLSIFEGHIYDTVGSFIGAVIIFMFSLSLASILVLHLSKKRCCRKDDPLACVSEAAGMVVLLAPALGAVGLMWSTHRMLYPGAFYHAC